MSKIPRLFELMAEKGIKAITLSGVIGVSSGNISDWKNGKSLPSADKVLKAAEFLGVSPEYLLGKTDIKNKPILTDELLKKIGAFPVGEMKPVRLVGTVRAGYGAVAYEDYLGFEKADVDNPDDYIFLKVKGNSMAPQILEGDLALVRLQPDVESGELAVVIINGDEGTVKKVIKKDGAVLLQPFNPEYLPQIVTDDYKIVGKVMEIKRKFST